MCSESGEELYHYLSCKDKFCLRCLLSRYLVNSYEIRGFEETFQELPLILKNFPKVQMEMTLVKEKALHQVFNRWEYHWHKGLLQEKPSPPPKKESPKKRERNEVVVVEGRRKNVRLLDLGTIPLGLEKNWNSDGYSFIPNGLRTQTVLHQIIWTGVTKVEGGNVEYRFFKEGDLELQGEWKNTPHKALLNVLVKKQIKEGKEPNEKALIKLGINGRLVLGVTYPPIQKIVKDHFELRNE